MVLVYIIFLILLSSILICVIILGQKVEKLLIVWQTQVKELQDVLGQVFNLLGGLGEENVANRKMIDCVIDLIREAKSTVTSDDRTMIKITDENGNEKFVEEDREF